MEVAAATAIENYFFVAVLLSVKVTGAIHEAKFGAEKRRRGSWYKDGGSPGIVVRQHTEHTLKRLFSSLSSPALSLLRSLAHSFESAWSDQLVSLLLLLRRRRRRSIWRRRSWKEGVRREEGGGRWAGHRDTGVCGRDTGAHGSRRFAILSCTALHPNSQGRLSFSVTCEFYEMMMMIV